MFSFRFFAGVGEFGIEAMCESASFSWSSFVGESGSVDVSFFMVKAVLVNDKFEDCGG